MPWYNSGSKIEILRFAPLGDPMQVKVGNSLISIKSDAEVIEVELNYPMYKIALVGNPNCGKTTIFNLLTGANQKVGNWPGVTESRKKIWFLRP